MTGRLVRIHMVGVLALFADCGAEALGTIGASAQILGSEDEILARFDLVNGRHYCDATQGEPLTKVVGDGTSIETVGRCDVRGESCRVDALTLDVPFTARPNRLRFKDLGSPASFVVFDVFFEYEGALEGVRIRGHGNALTDAASALRLGDRLKFSHSLDLLDGAIDGAEDLNEAKANALTFLGVVAAAMLDTANAPPSKYLLLDAARELEACSNRTQVRDAIRERVFEAVGDLLVPAGNPSHRLVDRALAIVERHYAKDVTDSMLAAQLGLSTSHFRYLFRQATGHPFHKYLVALRLEKARLLLIEQELPVSQVATAVGFAGLSHFSRAFAQRFSASPTHIRRAAG